MPYVFMLILIAIVALLAFIVHFIDQQYKQYKSFVAGHSSALKALSDLNQKYSSLFIPFIQFFDMDHSYDNRNFFEDISPRDYLIYQLVYIQKDVRKSIDDTNVNCTLFQLYEEDIHKLCVFNQYDTSELPKNAKKLSGIEQKLFNALKLKSTVEFFIHVRLWLTKINGSCYSGKDHIFYVPEIEQILVLLNQKSGDFYLNNDVWQSICRVERGKVSNKMRFAIYNRDHYRCQKCGRATDDLEIDHIFPISKGGKSTFDNLQTLCHRCNALKSNTLEPGVINPNAKQRDNIEICGVCGAPLVLRTGKYGKFYGCSNYPACKFTKKL